MKAVLGRKRESIHLQHYYCFFKILGIISVAQDCYTPSHLGTLVELVVIVIEYAYSQTEGEVTFLLNANESSTCVSHLL